MMAEEQWTVRRDGKFRLHPTARCPVCNSQLMLGNPTKNEWHCSALSTEKGHDFIEHYRASQRFEVARRGES